MSLYGNRGVHGQTVDAIARRVLSGELAQDATLDLIALQAEFGVSLTVMRARPRRAALAVQRGVWRLAAAQP